MADDRQAAQQAAQIEVFPARTDNIGVLIHDPATGATAAVDAPEAVAVLAALTRTGWTLTDILVTHKHADHIDGIPELKRRFPGVRVVAPLAEKDDIPLVDVTVSDGDTVKVGSWKHALSQLRGTRLGMWPTGLRATRRCSPATPCFLLGVVACSKARPVTCGARCKCCATCRMRRGCIAGMIIPCRTRFALSLDGDNAALRAYAASAEQTRADGHLTIPARLGDEKALNPFLRADDPAIARAVGLDGADAVSVFAELRERKNRS